MRWDNINCEILSKCNVFQAVTEQTLGGLDTNKR